MVSKQFAVTLESKSLIGVHCVLHVTGNFEPIKQVAALINSAGFLYLFELVGFVR